MLSLDKFAQEVALKIPELLDAQTEATVNKIMKNNDSEWTAVVVKSAESNLSPTIYLNSYYNEYLEGCSIDEIIEIIAKTARNSMVNVPIDVEGITSLDRCRERIVPRLVNTNMNQVLLESRPHRDVEDLSVTYCVLLDNAGDVAATVPVTYQLMDTWGISSDELYKLAIENQEKTERSVFVSMKDVLKGMMSDELDDIDSINSEAPQIYVLSNESKIGGAAAVLDNKMMSRVIDLIGENFYIIPSSIHEVLVVPDRGGIEKDDLESMVKEVNSSTVSKEEQLSEHVYVYSQEEGLKLAV